MLEPLKSEARPQGSMLCDRAPDYKVANLGGYFGSLSTNFESWGLLEIKGVGKEGKQRLICQLASQILTRKQSIKGSQCIGEHWTQENSKGIDEFRGHSLDCKVVYPVIGVFFYLRKANRFSMSGLHFSNSIVCPSELPPRASIVLGQMQCNDRNTTFLPCLPVTHMLNLCGPLGCGCRKDGLGLACLLALSLLAPVTLCTLQKCIHLEAK